LNRKNGKSGKKPFAARLFGGRFRLSTFALSTFNSSF